jgi:diaminopimelate decarboxylase
VRWLLCHPISQPSGGMMPYLEAIGGIPIQTLAERFGTPTYVYDASAIRRQFEMLRPFDVIRYAQKANSNLSILRLVCELGGKVDAVSAGEIERACAAGFSPESDPPDIVYTADVLDEPSRILIQERHIHVNIGTLDMLEPFAKLQSRREVTIRLNPGFGHGHGPKVNTGGPWSKHGIWFEQLEECRQIAQSCGLRITGFHVHIGSGSDLEHLSSVAKAARQLAAMCPQDLEMLSCGGGLPVPYRSTDLQIDIAQYFACWNESRRWLEDKVGRSLRLEVEPGRYLVAESGWLMCRVLSTKRIDGRMFYLVDAGFNDLVRPAFYGAYHPIYVGGNSRDGRGSSSWEEVVVAGPLCESGDVFTQGPGGQVEPRVLPPALPGDLIVIGCAGAYGFSMASNYNSKPFAAEVMVEQDTCRLIRRRQSLCDLFALEQGLEEGVGTGP